LTHTPREVFIGEQLSFYRSRNVNSRKRSCKRLSVFTRWLREKFCYNLYLSWLILPSGLNAMELVVSEWCAIVVHS
jgi:hypothetical protein